MALTPEDVVNKRFQPTKFREGYDQDEVDDFLDEVVVELRRLNQENDELRRKIAELQSGDGAAPATEAASTESVTTGKAGDQPAEETGAGKTSDQTTDQSAAAKTGTDKTGTGKGGTDKTTTQGKAPAAGAVPAAKGKDEVIASAPVASQPATASAAEAPGAGHEATASSAAGVLAMAQKLHDDYVAEGQTKRDQIIADARSEADGLVNDAQEKSRKTLAELEEKKTVLERQVEQLKGFERDYRARLKAYIEGQLRDLEKQGPIQDEVATATS